MKARNKQARPLAFAAARAALAMLLSALLLAAVAAPAAAGTREEPEIRYHGQAHELLAVDVQMSDRGLELVREAAEALDRGEGLPAQPPSDDFFTIHFPEDEVCCFLYHADGASYTLREGRAIALTQPLFSEVFRGISERDRARAEQLKWLLRTENGKNMLISRYLSGDGQEARRWYEENFYINDREKERYTYMGENALVSLVEADVQGRRQGLALLLTEVTEAGEDRLCACCLMARFNAGEAPISVSSLKAQLVICGVSREDGAAVLTEIDSNPLEFDRPFGEQELIAKLTPELKDHSISEEEARQKLADLLAEVFTDSF